MTSKNYTWKEFTDQVLKAIDFVSEYESLGVTGIKGVGDSRQGFCPIHNDQNKPSFSFFVTSGRFKCFAGCGEGSFADFVTLRTSKEFKDVIKEYGAKYNILPPESKKPLISDNLPAKYAEALINAREQLLWLIEARGLSMVSIRELKIGWNGDRYSIPVYDRYDRLVNIRLYKRLKPDSSEEKIKSYHAGGHMYGEARLYGLDEFLKTDTETPVIICEGEWDRILLRQNGFTAVTGTAGCNTWKKDWNKDFAGRHVYICYDNDDEGRRGALNVCIALHGTAKTIHTIHLPEEVGIKGDVTDFFARLKHSAQDFQDLMVHAVEYEGLKAAQQQQSAQANGMPILMKNFYPGPFTEEILRNYQFFCEGKKGLLWKFDPEEGLWQPNGDEFLELYLRTITTSLDDTMKVRNIIAEIIADVRGRTLPKNGKGMPEPRLHLIPFKNGVYDLDTDTFRQHDAADFFTFQIPWRYNPDATCPYLENIIDSFLPSDQSITLWELLAYCLFRSYPYQKFFMLTGAGSNGKSTNLIILSRMLGQKNFSSVSLHEIQNQQFAAYSLKNRHANIAGEMTYEDIKSTDLLKQLCGGDRIRGDRKFLSEVYFTNHAKLIFATNSIPQTRDCSDAFYRRAFLIQFTNKFKNDPAIEIKLRSDTPEMTAEFEGLLMKVIMHLKNLKKKNFIFTHDLSIQDSRSIYQSLSNPTIQFIAQHAVHTRNHEDFIFKWEFKKLLDEWLQLQGLNTYTSEKIGRIMKAMEIPEGKRTVADKQDRAWIGISWIENQRTKGQVRQEIQEFPTQSHKEKGMVVKPTPFPPSPPFSEAEDLKADWCAPRCDISERSKWSLCKINSPCPKLATSAGAR